MTQAALSADSGTTAAPPARGRYTVLALVCSLSMITYLDRVCFGVAAPLVAAELGLSSVTELKWAFTAFAIAYAIFEIPAGWMGDRWGPRSTLIRIVLWWSACTALTGVVGMQWGSWTLGGLGLLVTLRFLFGAGEAGAYPNITRAIHNWFPGEEWEFAQGLVWMSGRIVGGLTPLIWALLVTGTAFTSPLVNWRGAFLLFGVIGVVWCLLFRLLFRNHPPSVRADDRAAPDDHSATQIIAATQSDAHSHHAIPWRWMLTNPSLIALCLMYSLLNYGWAFNITYLPSFLEQRFDLPASDTLGAIYRGAPLWVGAFGCYLGSYVISALDRWIRNRRRSRRTLGTLAMLSCAACWVIAARTDNVHLFCISVAAAAFCVDLTLGASWATCQDIGQKHAAVVAALMNTIGTLGAALAVWLTGTLVQQSLQAAADRLQVKVTDLPPSEFFTANTAGYTLVFGTYAAVYVLAAIFWQLTAARSRPVEAI